MQEYKKAREKNYNKFYYENVTKIKRKAKAKAKAKAEKEVIEKVCAMCGKTFTTTNSRTKYCSSACKNERNLQYQKEYRKTPKAIAKLKE